MSYVITTDVFCDGEGCSLWTHGETGQYPLRKEAKQRAESEGWKVTANKAYCPACQRKDGK